MFLRTWQFIQDWISRIHCVVRLAFCAIPKDICWKSPSIITLLTDSQPSFLCPRYKSEEKWFCSPLLLAQYPDAHYWAGQRGYTFLLNFFLHGGVCGLPMLWTPMSWPSLSYSVLYKGTNSYYLFCVSLCLAFKISHLIFKTLQIKNHYVHFSKKINTQLSEKLRDFLKNTQLESNRTGSCLQSSTLSTTQYLLPLIAMKICLVGKTLKLAKWFIIFVAHPVSSSHQFLSHRTSSVTSSAWSSFLLVLTV